MSKRARAYTIQVGAADGIGVEGPYTLSVYYDPDADRDGLLDARTAARVRVAAPPPAAVPTPTAMA